MKFSPHAYQNEAVQFFLDRDYAGLFADPGLGKTVTALTVIDWLKLIEGCTPLVIAPIRPLKSTWPEEIEQWDHTKHMSYQVLHGKDKTIRDGVDVYLVNPEGVKALFEQPAAKRFDTLIIDESSKFKNWGAQRTKILKRNLKQFKRRYILTGTPAPNGLLDLFSQIFLLDRGATFGKAITKYKEQFFHTTDWHGYNWVPNVGAEKVIYDAIAPFTLRLDGEKLLDLPDFVYSDYWVTLPKEAMRVYKQMEKDMFAFLDQEKGDALVANGASSAYGKCRQIASGVVYSGDGILEPVVTKQLHTSKLDALGGIVDELQGKPVFVAYNYRHELDALVKKFKAPYIGGGVSAGEGARLVAAWNRGELPMLLAHPASAGHGLNLQKGPGRHIVWYSLTDDLENYLQFNRRIRRQGVDSKVFVYHLMAEGTVDVAIKGRLGQKDETQGSLLDALLRYRAKELE